MKYFTAKDAPSGYTVYIWNNKSLASEVKYFNAKDSLTSSTILEFNDNGFYTKAEYKNGKGVVVRTLKMDYKTYDDKGNWLTAVCYDNGKPTYFAKREYVYY